MDFKEELTRIGIFAEPEADAGLSAAKIAGRDLVFPQLLVKAARPVLRISQQEGVGHRVTFPCPTGIAFNNSATYDDADLGVLGANTLNAIQTAKESGLGTGISDLVKGLGKAAKNVGKDATGASALAAELLNGTQGRAIGIGGRALLNKNVTTEFTGVTTRNFSFQYKLVPSNAQEAKDIADIVRIFQRELYPAKASGGNGEVLRYPCRWKLEFLTSINGERLLGVPAIAECYMDSFSATINGSNAWHVDKYPVETDIAFGFKEFRALTAEDLDSLNLQGTISFSSQTSSVTSR